MSLQCMVVVTGLGEEGGMQEPEVGLGKCPGHTGVST